MLKIKLNGIKIKQKEEKKAIDNLVTKNIFKLRDTKKYVKEYEKNTKYFPFWGTEINLGAQGSGKTIDMVYKAYNRIKDRPKTIILSNVDLLIPIKNEIRFFKNYEELAKHLTQLDPEYPYGYLILIDELQNVLSDMYTRAIDPILLQLLSQQRKTSINILGTAQLYEKIPLGFRQYNAQNGKLYECKKIGLLQIVRAIDMDTVNYETISRRHIKSYKWYFHTVNLYKSYNTKAPVTTLQGIFKGKEKIKND